MQFKSKDGTNKTEEFCENNWLIRDDAQKAIKIYMKNMRTLNTMQIYQKMMNKALNGDVNAAKYVENFHNSDSLKIQRTSWTCYYLVLIFLRSKVVRDDQ